MQKDQIVSQHCVTVVTGMDSSNVTSYPSYFQVDQMPIRYMIWLATVTQTVTGNKVTFRSIQVWPRGPEMGMKSL